MMISEMFTIISLLLVINICTNVAAEFSIIKKIVSSGVSTQSESWQIPTEIIEKFLITQKIEKIIDTDFTLDDLQLFTKGQESEDLKLTAEELLKKNGYPVIETYKVITEDGYILTLFRIPSSGEPVLLMHGLLMSSDDWVTPGPESGLAYLLAAEGFDVWLGNVRGNKYSREHVRLSPDSAEFWDFSWDEMGRYDLPATIDFILNATQHSQLIYIGHSQGTTSFFVMGSEKSEYSNKVSLMIAMAPAAAIPNQRSPYLNLMKYLNLYNPDIMFQILKKAGQYEFAPPEGVLKAIQNLVCGNSELAATVCSNPLFLITGFSYSQLNVSNLPVLFSHAPAGASIKQFQHYNQGMISRKFQPFTLINPIENILLLDSKTSREYEVGNIVTPMALFYSENDWIVTEPDVLNLISKLNPEYVIDVYKVPDPINHIDFMYGLGIKSLIFPRIIKNIKKTLT